MGRDRTFEWACRFCGAKGEIAFPCRTLVELLPLIDRDHREKSEGKCEHLGDEEIRCQ